MFLGTKSWRQVCGCVSPMLLFHTFLLSPEPPLVLCWDQICFVVCVYAFPSQTSSGECSMSGQTVWRRLPAELRVFEPCWWKCRTVGLGGPRVENSAGYANAENSIPAGLIILNSSNITLNAFAQISVVCSFVCVRAYVRVRLHACVPSCVRACACVCLCVRACVRACVHEFRAQVPQVPCAGSVFF